MKRGFFLLTSSRLHKKATAAEISPAGDARALLRVHPELEGLVLPMDSDAHYLENMIDPLFWLDLPDVSARSLIAVLNGELLVPWHRPGRTADGLSWEQNQNK